VAVTFKSAVDDPSRIPKSTAVGALVGARPFHIEALSGWFDFNRAPFFQSFVEVRVETSRKRVVLILNGIRGPLHWRDLQTGGTVLRLGATPHDPVEFVVPMDRE
jgi:hypothetical protein